MKFIGFGNAHGRKQVTNYDLSNIMDTTDESIRKKTGIESRWFAEDETNADMAYSAACNALEDADIKDMEEIDGIIVCTFTPDRATPSVANEVAGRLNLKEEILSIDINGACSGFIYGCTVAEALLRTERYNKIIVVGSERISQVMPLYDRNTDVLFGDAAGAVVCTGSNDGYFISKNGLIANSEALSCERFDPQIKMQGQEVYRFAVNKVPELVRGVLKESRFDGSEIDWFVFHQANERIIKSSMEKLGIPMEKTFLNIQNFGNTSAASIPVVLGDMRKKGLLKEGMKVLSVGFGAGLTYGVMICKL